MAAGTQQAGSGSVTICLMAGGGPIAPTQHGPEDLEIDHG
jgi:hypothetical protein